MNAFKFLIFCIIPFAVSAKTFDIADLKLDVNGYAGYTYIDSTVKNRVLKSTPELGLILSLKITDELSAYTQFEYSNTIDNALVYSFLSFDKLITENFQVGMKAGRLRHDCALYNSGRVNPRTRQGIIMPQSIYWTVLRHILTSGNGINFNFKWGNLEASYTIDDPIIEDPIDEAEVWTGGLLSSIQNHFGSHQLGIVKYTFDDIPLMVKSTFMYVNLGNDSSPLMHFVYPEYYKKDQKVYITTLGFEYGIKDDLIWSSEVIGIKPFYANWDLKGWSYGTSHTLRYEATDNVMLYTNYNYYFSSYTNGKSWYTNTHDVSVGINYHRNNWMIGAEIHKINGGRWVHPDDWNNDPDDYKDWYMGALNFTYFF